MTLGSAIAIRVGSTATAAALVLTACAAEGGTGWTTPTEPTTATSDPNPERAAIDARSYFDDYTEAVDQDLATPAMEVATDGAIAPMPIVPVEPGILDDNTFVDPGASTWTATGDDAESTFALDVDTASFSVARRFVDQGFLPDPASIRVEEWINAVDPGDGPAGNDGLAIAATSTMSPYATGVETVRIAVSSAHLTADQRPPANVTFVIDTSGSMDIRERLGLVKSSLALLATQLRGDDTISIVTYGTDAAPLLAPTAAADTATIVAAIEQLTPGGSTNMEDGLRLGYRQAREAFRPDGVNVVVLASDGVANVGLSDPDGLTEMIRQAGSEGISLVAVGYGMGNFNDDLMEQLANQGDGFYSYVDTFEQAERLFVEELTPTLTVVAREAKSQVVFDPDVVSEYRLVGYENRELDDAAFRDDTVDAGEVGAGHHAVALYEIRRTPNGGGRSPGEARLRWLPADSNAAIETAVVLPPTAGEPTDELRLVTLVAAAAELLRGDAVAADRQLDLGALADEAAALADAGVAGADAIADLLGRARTIG